MNKWHYFCPSCIIAKYKRLLDGFEKEMVKEYGRCTRCNMMTRFKVRDNG